MGGGRRVPMAVRRTPAVSPRPGAGGTDSEWRSALPSGMARVLLDEVVHTDYGQLDLVWSDDAIGFDGDTDTFFRGQVNGVVGAASGDGVYINLARRSGGSRVRVVALDAEPPPPPAASEDVVEVSVAVPSGAAVRWLSWAGESSGERGSGAGHVPAPLQCARPGCRS